MGLHVSTADHHHRLSAYVPVVGDGLLEVVALLRAPTVVGRLGRADDDHRAGMDRFQHSE